MFSLVLLFLDMIESIDLLRIGDTEIEFTSPRRGVIICHDGPEKFLDLRMASSVLFMAGESHFPPDTDTWNNLSCMSIAGTIRDIDNKPTMHRRMKFAFCYKHYGSCKCVLEQEIYCGFGLRLKIDIFNKNMMSYNKYSEWYLLRNEFGAIIESINRFASFDCSERKESINLLSDLREIFKKEGDIESPLQNLFANENNCVSKYRSVSGPSTDYYMYLQGIFSDPQFYDLDREIADYFFDHRTEIISFSV